MGTRQLFSSAEWLAWLGATLAACVTLTSFIYANFETRAGSEQTQESNQATLSEIKSSLNTMQQSIDRVEHKVDFLDGKISGGR